MKKFLMFLAAAAMMINFSSCGNDDGGDGDDKKNHCKIGSTTYDLNYADFYIGSAGSSNELAEYDIYFAEDATPYDAGGEWEPEGLVVNLYSLYADKSAATEGQMYSGTYNYSAERTAMSHDGYSFYWLPDYQVRIGQEFVSESQLVIKINHVSGNVYEIEWSGAIDGDGNAVSGYYKGPVIDGL
ncbi:MAG: hypothetical protein IKM58_00650 [Tidjanibacter sp.]|nr:hypothetical protein [Tidjanibacter sp.]